MTTQALLAKVTDRQIQGIKGLGVIWADIREEIEQLGGTVLDSYVLLGEYDFQIMFEADEDTALQVALAVQRQGLETKTMRAISTDHLGELVDDT